VVTTANVDIAFFTREGIKLFQQGMGRDGFFQGVATANFVFDPKCFFDAMTQRFFVVAPELDDAAKTSGVLIAVSESADPRGNWKKYRVNAKITDAGGEYWLDYPGFGFNKDRVVISGNMFGFENGWGGVQVISLNKANLIAGNTADGVTYRISGLGSVQFSKSHDPLSNAVYGAAYSSTTSMRLFALKSTEMPNAPLVSEDVPVPAFDFPPSARSTAGHQLDALDGRLMTVANRNGRLVMTHSTKPMGTTHVGARWYEFLTLNWPNSGLPKLGQSGDVQGSADQDYFMPAIGINRRNDIALTFSRSGPTITADVMVTGRRASDPAGTMGKPVRVATSSGDYGGAGVNRWGDYFSIEVDPRNDLTFWGMGMTSANGAWQTQINSWTITPDVANAKAHRATAVKVLAPQGAFQSGKLPDVWTADQGVYSVRSTYISNLGHVAAAELTYDVKVPAAQATGIGVRLKAKSIGAATTMFWLYNYRTKVYDFVQATPATATPSTVLLKLEKEVLTDYFAADGKVKAVIRSITPSRQGKAFTLAIDEATLLVAG
jgi:hypothetical protein